ncbi:HpcH/HpaI aldolase/citrate lyase family protein [Streptomyces zingiberis]|uniref:CoA ester lyase n=1 Tax=Streptomyces zingiberis TaxID=2053010 RepID=A0ABX1BXH6_9ACTN|nr:CoA ester lyase [Streptomyces zingiberis]NJQ00192.1 CoA ester lyase [Streptomyces zingiberis]
MKLDLDALSHARSLLFVPGDRPELFDRAVDSGADAVVIDLEDAVAPERKTAAREAARAWLGRGGPAVVRVNPAGTEGFGADIGAVAGLAAAVVLPKCESPAGIGRVHAEARCPVPVIPLVETAAGLVNAESLCRAEGVVRAALGTVDLATELGVEPDDEEALRYARSRLVLASAAAGLPGPVDGVTTDLRDPVRVRGDSRRARRLGLYAKLCVHPLQVPVVNDVMTPTAAEITWAREVTGRAGGGVFVVDGRMTDAPVVARANRVLDRSRRFTEGNTRG